MNSEEKILKLINFEPSEDTQDEAIKHSYLQKLRGLKVDALKRDAVNLKDNLDNIDLKTQEIAFAHYPAFIKTAESSRHVLKGWNEATKNVEGLIDNLPKFADKCDSFVGSTLDIQSASRLNSVTMKKHVDLLEILELPQLMELSIREEKYEDALELAAYVQKMGTSFEKVAIVNSILKRIESSWHVMISQLLNELKCDLTLPKCLKIVGYIRRMQAFSTPELKLKFLQTRDSWFKSVLAAIPKTDVHVHITKTTEATRVNLFNIVTQYKALFEDDHGKDGNSKVNLIFNSWLHEKIDDYLRSLESDLSVSNFNLIDISSILGQCMYFGVSFSRIGVDFRAQLVPIFLKTITKYLNVCVVRATKQFEIDMEHFTLINRDIVALKRNKNEGLDSVKPTAASLESLLDFPPLAVYCNALTNIFNELRVCAPLAVAQPFVVMLENSLENVSKSILNFYRNEQQAFGPKEKESFLRMCSCFSFDLLTCLQEYINLIFPLKTKHIRQSESQMNLRNEKILEHIEHLLPEHYETSKI